MTRIIIHAGFHKTGTTGLQDFLRLNRAALSDHADIYLGQQLGEARRAGRLYGERPWFARRRHFQRSFASFLATIPDADTILISRESFSGAMPGATRFGRSITGYGRVAETLARDILTAFQTRFGTTAQIEFLYTTRAKPAFLQSIWGHHLRTKQLTDDLGRFTARFAKAPPLDTEAARIATALAPVPVHIAPLEDAANHRLGHGATILRLLHIDPTTWDHFQPPIDRYTGPSDELRATFLRMNRSQQDTADLRAQKEALYKGEST